VVSMVIVFTVGAVFEIHIRAILENHEQRERKKHFTES
jgi:hypothetical protein